MNGEQDAESSGSVDEDFSDAESVEEEEEEEEEAEPQEDPLVAAERAKEEGNVQFKQQRYGMAIDLYTRAHGALSLSPPLLYYNDFDLRTISSPHSIVSHMRISGGLLRPCYGRAQRQGTELSDKPGSMLYGAETVQSCVRRLPGRRKPPTRLSSIQNPPPSRALPTGIRPVFPSTPHDRLHPRFRT